MLRKLLPIAVSCFDYLNNTNGDNKSDYQDRLILSIAYLQTIFAREGSLAAVASNQCCPAIQAYLAAYCKNQYRFVRWMRYRNCFEYGFAESP